MSKYYVRTIKKAATLSILLILQGCMASYHEPLASTPTADINFNSFRNIRGEINAVRIYKNPIRCLDEESTTYGFSATPVRIPANKLLTFVYYHQQYLGMKMGGYDYNICSYIISFIPKENRSYHVKVQEGVEINGKYSCDISFLDNTNPSNKIPIKYVVRYENSIAKPIEFTKQCDNNSYLLNQLK